MTLSNSKRELYETIARQSQTKLVATQHAKTLNGPPLRLERVRSRDSNCSTLMKPGSPPALQKRLTSVDKRRMPPARFASLTLKPE